MDSDKDTSAQQHGAPIGISSSENTILQQIPQQSTSTPPTTTSKSVSYSSHGNNPFSGRKIISLLVGIIIVAVILFAAITLYSSFSQRAEKVTLVYWGVWEDPVTYQSVFSEFQKKYPYVEIKYEKQDITKLDKYVDRLRNRVLGEASGERPDIFRFHNSWLPLIGRLLSPVPPEVAQEAELDSQYFDVIKKDVSRSGVFYGIPLEMDTLALFINEDIYKESDIQTKPETWDEVIQAAKQAVRYDDNIFSDSIIRAGIGMGTFDNVEHSSDIMSLLFVQNGADMKDFLGPTRKFAEGALGFYTAFAQSNSEERVWDSTLENSKLAFAKGNLAMYLGYARDIPDIRSQNPTLNMTIIPVPHVAGSEQSRNKTIANYWVEGVSIKSSHQKEAFELLKFMSEKENLERIFNEQAKQRVIGMPFPRKDMLKTLRNNQLLYPIADQGNKATSTMFSSNTYDGSQVEELNSYLGNAIRSMNSGTPAESVIDTLAQGVNGVYAKLSQ